MRNMWILLVVALSACGLNGNYRDQDFEIRAVNEFDVSRYHGVWYEVARFPNWFEKECRAVAAEYFPRPDGLMGIRNTCQKIDGVRTIEGYGRQVQGGQFLVSFTEVPPLEGDWWVLYVSPAYDVAVIGEPAGDFGWILARKPQMSMAELQVPLAVLRQNGYDTARLWLATGGG
ncbi:lipocalin family protein [Algicella marina]|uniref:Outer membrane lipoprotein Blc n=1 Tax=Algicella marina TaxID=2683284 RepID=A0A6P1T2G4_9RHOB|nr:lipocalin family protein [Algicella marina]QHQ35843.1 lipocalin [Algicella marina]